MYRSAVLTVLALVTACGTDNAPTVCADAEARLGFRPCVHRVDSADTWAAMAAPLTPVDQVRTTRYMVPARDDARLPVLFEDATASFRAHFHFLTQAFGDLFPALTLDEYTELITDPERREFFTGHIAEYILEDSSRVYGYIVWAEQTAAETLTCAQARQVHAQLSGAFDLTPLAIVPTDNFQREVLSDCDVPLHDPATALDYEVYTRAVGYGTVRRYTLTELADATEAAEFHWQDILVIEEAPFDIETVISGAVTGTRQGELSHLNVRSASRGTPNCYVKGAHGLMERWEDQLVRIECAANALTIEPATPAEAEAWWAQLRPEPVALPSPQLSWTALTDLHDLPTDTKADRALGQSRYGAKGTNLATLYQRIPGEVQLDGFLLPFHYYDAFIRSHGFDQSIAALLDDEQFQTDGARRRVELQELRSAMRAASCDVALLSDLDAQIRASFGSDTQMVRFRSSSNAEDALRFNGAGLYSSTSACLADQLDEDEIGPSRCDPDQPSERGLCRALTKVWASLWAPKAYEERSWYGINHRDAAMGILINTRTKSERANIVMFSGNPLGPRRDDYLVNAQIGELDVVSSQPGVWPEKDLLGVDSTSGALTDIQRVRASTEVAEGQFVLDDQQLEELGTMLWSITEAYPIDAAAPEGQRIILDTEWKLRADGQFLIKQVRPFLD